MNRLRRVPFGAFLNEVGAVQEEFSRLLNRVTPFAVSPQSVAAPLLNVWENEHELIVESDLPGIDSTKLDVTITEGNQLTIQGERATPDLKGSAWVRQERPVGTFTRSVTLPSLVDADKVEAQYEQGVLRLKLPKHEAAKPRKIQVHTGA